MIGDISYDLVMNDDMQFVEGTFRVDGGDWQVFIFSKKKGVNVEPHWQHSRWESGITGLVFGVPSHLRLSKQLVEQSLSQAVGLKSWTEVCGPDSIQLR